MSSPNWTLVCALALGCVAFLGKRYLSKPKYRRSHPLPPGPPGLPFIGNIMGVNMNAPWQTYAEWAKTYGDLVFARLFGKDIIIINSETVAKELLENRSSNYSDRPHMITSDLCGIGFNSALLRYGDRWRLHRRFFHQTFRREAVSRFTPLQHRKTCQLLRRLLENPDSLSDHVFEYTTSLILNSVYDYDPSSRQDELVHMMDKVLEVVMVALRPETAMIAEAFPAFLKLPSWLPGMSFKKKMTDAKEFSKVYVERPFAQCVQRMTSGSYSPSMIYDALNDVEGKGNSGDESWMGGLKGAAATAFLAASETTNANLMTFFLMMVMHPEAQKKVQEQIDAVVGRDRLPSLEDRASLTYVDAIIRETLRCYPLIPLCVPHAVVDDDIYNGFLIPKGAIVLPNLWAMAHDESKYPKPHEFIPERFLEADGTLKPYCTEHLAFGFGRRICVGRYFADASLWSVIAKFLAVYSILKPLDANGEEVTVEPKFGGGASIYPLPFGFRIVPRDPRMGAKGLEDLIAASTA